MGATLSMNADDMLQFSRPRTSNASKLLELAEKAAVLTRDVEERWETLPEREREVLRTLAYTVIAPPGGVRRLSYDLLGRSLLAFALIRGEIDALRTYLTATAVLVGAIFERIESDHAQYKSAMASAVEDALRTTKERSPMSPEEFRDWLATVADQARREV